MPNNDDDDDEWYRGALCDHPLPAVVDNWTHGTV